LTAENLNQELKDAEAEKIMDEVTTEEKKE